MFKKMLTFILAFQGVLVPVCLASSDDILVKDPGAALEWQKVNLEDRIHSKLTQAIGASLPAQSFVLTVDVVLKEKPQPTPTATPTPGIDNDKVYLGKLELDAPYTELVEHEANIFKNILKIKVSLLLDQSVSESKKQVIQKIIENGVNSIARGEGSLEPEITIDKVELSTAEELSLNKLLVEFKLPIGFILGTLIFSFVFMLMFLGYRGIERKKISVMEAQNEREASTMHIKTEQTGTAGVAVAGVTGGVVAGNASAGWNPGEEELAIENAKKGFAKFKTLIKETPEKASDLVKQWIKAPVRGAHEALMFLPQVLSTDEFMAIFQHLNIEDRKVWRRVLGSGFDPNDAHIASTFVGSQIIDSLLVPTPTLDGDLKKLISELDSAESVELANQNPELGGILVNLLPATQVSQVLSLLTPETANAVTLASLKFSESEIQAKSGQLKQAIQAVTGKGKPQSVPFVDRASELISQMGPEKEGSIFEALAESGNYKILQGMVKQFFPAELALKLPVSVIKSSLDRIPADRKAEMIVSRTPEERTILLDAIGKAGSKLRDLIDLEVTQVEQNPTRKRKSEKNKSQYWRDWIGIVRSLIQTQELIADQVEPTLEAWLYEKTRGQIGQAPGAAGQEGTPSDQASKAA